jgi:hypothetical protein
MNYHAADVASTAHEPVGLQTAAVLPASFAPAARPLTCADSLPILRFPSTMKGGDPVSYTKRCHLAGIAR